MSISFQGLRTVLKNTGIPVYRDEPKAEATYPYIIYGFVDEDYKRCSNQVINELPMYQVTYVTSGVESELKTLKDALKNNGVEFSRFTSGPFDENDLKITQYNTYVRCVHGAE